MFYLCLLYSEQYMFYLLCFLQILIKLYLFTDRVKYKRVVVLEVAFDFSLSVL